MGFQDRASNEITEYVVGKLATELNLDPTKDFILVPVLYTVFGECLIPYTANLVNMLVVPGVPEAGKATVVVQTPYGPVVGDDSPKDAFLKCLEEKLQPCNVTVAAVDGWDVLHAKYGEVHCATNAIRIPPPPEKQWWEK
jgi:hypothetical protein